MIELDHEGRIWVSAADGSNWELLCLYCHENEHARQQVADVYGEATPGEEREPRSTYRPFADLKDLLQRKP